MFHITREGNEIRNGFNFYPISDPYSFGGKFRIGQRLWTVRYSTARGKWFVNYANPTKAEAEAIMKEWN